MTCLHVATVMSSTEGVPINAHKMQPSVSDICHEWWSCELAGLISDVWPLLTIGLLSLIVLVAVGYLRSARDVVETEKSRTRAEREAFLRFADRIDDVPPTASRRVNPTDSGVLLAQSVPAHTDSGMEAVRSAYRETVMAIDHYEEDYGEALIENMAFEFGRYIAVTVETGSQLTPQLKQALKTAAGRAAAERSRFMGTLERETDSLDEAHDTFTSIQQELESYQPEALIESSYQTLVEKFDMLDGLEDGCTAALKERQRQLQDGPFNRDTPRNTPNLVEYLYAELTVDYPVLSAGLKIHQRIRNSRQAITRAACIRA